MHSKWLDVGMDLAAFHLQSTRYDDIKPPAFGQYPHLTSIERERERINEPTKEEVEQQIDETIEKKKERQRRLAKFSSLGSLLRRRRKKNAHPSGDDNDDDPNNATATATTNTNNDVTQQTTNNNTKHHRKGRASGRDESTVNRASLHSRIKQTRKNINAPHTAKKPVPKPFNVPKPIKISKMAAKKAHRRVVSSVSCVTVASNTNHPQQKITTTNLLDERPLFLQEAAHLLSLLSAVAMSTLRNDLEHAESPLITFTPGE